MSVTKTAKLHNEKRIEAAERLADEYGSFNAFVRVALDEFDSESRLEREIEEISEELEQKQERLDELREQDEEDEGSEQEGTEDVPEGLEELYETTEGDNKWRTTPTLSPQSEMKGL